MNPKENKIYVYIGPSIRGVIQNGSIFQGAIPHVEKYPQIEKLIVADTEAAEAKIKVKTPGNSLNSAYCALLSAE